MWYIIVIFVYKDTWSITSFIKDVLLVSKFEVIVECFVHVLSRGKISPFVVYLQFLEQFPACPSFSVLVPDTRI